MERNSENYLNTNIRFPSVWFENTMTEDEKTELKKYLLNNGWFIQKLQKIIENYKETVDNKELRDDFYSTPNLVERLILNNGKRQAYDEILSLFKFMETNPNV